MSETHQGQCEEYSRMPHNLLPAYPHPWPLHSSALGIHPPLISPRLCHLPSASSQSCCFFLSEINPHLSESVAYPGLNFEVGPSIALSFCQILGCMLDLCAPGISVHTHLSHSPLSFLRTEVMSDKLLNPQTLTHHREAGEQNA